MARRASKKKKKKSNIKAEVSTRSGQIGLIWIRHTDKVIHASAEKLVSFCCRNQTNGNRRDMSKFGWLVKAKVQLVTPQGVRGWQGRGLFSLPQSPSRPQLSPKSVWRIKKNTKTAKKELVEIEALFWDPTADHYDQFGIIRDKRENRTAGECGDSSSHPFPSRSCYPYPVLSRWPALISLTRKCEVALAKRIFRYRFLNLSVEVVGCWECDEMFTFF